MSHQSDPRNRVCTKAQVRKFVKKETRDIHKTSRNLRTAADVLNLLSRLDPLSEPDVEDEYRESKMKRDNGKHRKR